MIGCQYVNNGNTERVIRREDRNTGQSGHLAGLSCDNLGLLCPADVELNIIDFFLFISATDIMHHISSLGNLKDIK